MRILVLADKILRRNLGDGLRVHGLVRPLAERHHFDLICFARRGETLDMDMRNLFRDVALIPAPETERSPFARRLIQSISGKDFKLSTEAMRTALSAAVDSGRYVLILEVAANTLPNLPRGALNAPLIVDSIDEPLLRELRGLRNAPWKKRPEHLYRAWRFWQYERSMLGRADLNIYVSEVDAGLYRRFFPGRLVAVVPNGVDTDYFAPRTTPPHGAYVVFEGNMNYAPNVDTARRLVKEVLPFLARRMPDVRIGLVGRDPVTEVQRLASDRVEVTGTVADVRPYLAQASVFACPMKLGSGIKNKILQAWAMARPVVATSASLGGLSALDGVNILVRDRPEAFADAVADLILNPALATAIGTAGRATAEREYSWAYRAEQFEGLLMNALGNRRATLVAINAKADGCSATVAKAG